MRAPCTAWWSGWASATATCRKARSATPTSRYARWARRIRHPHGNQQNVNSFRFLERAIQFEARRQIELIEDGGTVVQETRLYDADRDETRSMRSKEDAHDYRYFPDPDLPPLVIGQDWVDAVRAGMLNCRPPSAARFEADYGLPAYDAAQLTVSRAMADYFEAVARACRPGQTGRQLDHGRSRGHPEPRREGHRRRARIGSRPGGPDPTASSTARFPTRSPATCSPPCGRAKTAATPDAIIAARGLKQISDSGAIGAMIDEVLAANPPSSRNTGPASRKPSTRWSARSEGRQGQGQPQQVNELLKES